MSSRILIAVLGLSACAHAQASAYHTGKLLQTESVQCLAANGEPTAPASTVDCEEFVLEGQSVLFHFRTLDPKQPVSIPVGKVAQYRVHEGHFFLRVDARDREFKVVSMEPAASKATPVKSVKLNHLQ